MAKVIFLHGGPGFTDYLQPYFENMFKEHECTFYDQLQGNDIKMDNLIGQLDELVDSFSSRPILVGHSWGGVLGAEYAKQNKGKLLGLVLMSTGLDYKQWTLYNDELEQKGLSDISREELFFVRDELVSGKEMFDHDSWSGFSEETFESIFEDYLKTYNLLESLNDLHIPILNIYGENDLRFSKNVTTTFKKYNEKIEDLEVENSGHFPFLLEINRNKILSKINSFIINCD